MIQTASIYEEDKPKGRIIAVTRTKPKDWGYEYKPILSPSWRLIKKYKDGFISQEQFKERYLSEMRHLYRATTILKSFAQECIENDVVLCCYCKQGDFCHRDILKEILEKIIKSVDNEELK